MADPEVTEWRFHIGAHKTGTTHLQKSLASRTDELREHSVSYIPLSAARPLLRPYIEKRRRSDVAHRVARAFPLVSTPFVRAHVRRRVPELAAKLRAHQAGRGRLVVSEENVLCDAWNWRSGPKRIYPDLSFLYYLEALASEAPMRIFVAVRSLDGFCVSYYCESLKYHRLQRSDLMTTVARLKTRDAVWTDLLRRIRAIVPSARLEVWNYADYAGHWREFHASLCGCALRAVPDIALPSGTRTPSETAVSTAEGLDLALGRRRTSRIRELFVADVETGMREKFDPLDEATKSCLRENFARDLAEIDRLFPGALRKFG